MKIIAFILVCTLGTADARCNGERCAAGTYHTVLMWFMSRALFSGERYPSIKRRAYFPLFPFPSFPRLHHWTLRAQLYRALLRAQMPKSSMRSWLQGRSLCGMVRFVFPFPYYSSFPTFNDIIRCTYGHMWSWTNVRGNVAHYDFPLLWTNRRDVCTPLKKRKDPAGVAFFLLSLAPPHTSRN